MFTYTLGYKNQYLSCDLCQLGITQKSIILFFFIEKGTKAMSNNRILHTMLRVRDLEQAIDFYTQILGMRLLRQHENKEYQYTLAFVGYGDESQGAVIELTYNWGTKDYVHGNAFGHIAIGVEDIYQTCDAIRQSGAKITREPGPVKGGCTLIAFVEDPDGYKIELIQRKDAASQDKL